MANLAPQPCDEAAILAPPCEHPVTAGGAWILAATILGSSMAFIDGTVVNVALPALQSSLGAEPRGRAMGRRILRPVPGRAAAHRRIAWGPIRPPQDLRRRCRDLLRCPRPGAAWRPESAS